MAAQSAGDFIPDTHDLTEPAAAAQGCEACDLYLHANQTDQEDKAGVPFVGPAGRLLDKALAAPGIDRDRLYVTNAVKHFKFTLSERGSAVSTRRPAAPR
jgi:uracil-DNA glycosylase